MTFDQYADEQKRLRELLLKKRSFDQGLELCLSQNAQLHQSPEGSSAATFGDRLVENLTEKAFSYRPDGEFETIAWCLWHITRIEDAIGNVLIAETDQVFDAEWKRRINVAMADTGNAFSKKDVDDFGAAAVMSELLAYRRAVGTRSQQIIGSIAQGAITKKPSEKALARILSEGVLTTEKESFWLKDFWASKTIGGLLLLPMARHQMMHIPNCFRLKDLANRAP